MNIEIIRDLYDAHRERFGQIFYDAFHELYRFLAPREKATILLARSARSDRIISALYDGQFAGASTLDMEGEDIYAWRAEDFREILGRFHGAIKYFLAQKMRGESIIEGAIRIDQLAVAQEMRGRGVGTALLAATEDYARDHGFESVQLEVTDTNPRARSLYERVGYEAVETKHIPLLRPLIGFSAYTIMIKLV